MKFLFTITIIAMLLGAANVFSQTAPIAVTVTAGATVPINNQGTNGSIIRNTHTFTWKDAGGLQRSALMVDQSANGCGFLRQFTYNVSGTDRVCAGTGTNGPETYGDGFVQNHTANGGDNEATTTTGTTSLPLLGRHHAIIQFSLPTYTIYDPNNGGGTVPTTIQWFFATGRDYPVYSITQDARGTAGNIGGDSRSPYGDMHYDGHNFTTGSWSGDNIGGASMGDTYKWVSVQNGLTSESTLLTTNSGWKYTEANTIPYAMEWTQTVNAEQGHVQTQPISAKDAGRSDWSDPASARLYTNSQQLNGPMIGDEQWMYQIAAYGVLSNTGGSAKRLTWGTNWGTIGGFDNWWMSDNPPGSAYKEFTRHFDGAAANQNFGSRTVGNKGMLLCYSILDVFGLHNSGAYDAAGYKNGATGKMVTQMENMQKAALTTTVGSVVTIGPAGVGLTTAPADQVSYSPAGYNPVYASWEVTAAANNATFTLTPGTLAAIQTPVFVVNNFTATDISSLTVNGVAKTADVDYFASIDATAGKLWVTLNSTISSATTVTIIPISVGLPLRLIDFWAMQSNNGIQLQWKTANESNTQFFELAYSTDGSSFSTIGHIAAKGSGDNHYSYIDKRPAVTGHVFYRLTMVDKDGQFTYSNIVDLSIAPTQLSAIIYPSPTKNRATISIYNNSLLHTKAFLIDMTGKTLQSFDIEQSTFNLNISGYPVGVYWIRLADGETLNLIKD